MKPTLAVWMFFGLLGLAQAVPSTMAFQGVVKAGGLPYSGQGFFKFALFNATSGAKLWDNTGATAGGEPTAAVSLPVTAGLVSTALGNTAAGFAALPPGVFRSDASLRVWFSANKTGPFEVLSPDATLTTAPYAAVAAVALSADGATALGGVPAASYARAPFSLGYSSGLPGTCDLKVQIGTGAATDTIRFAGSAGASFARDAGSGLPVGSPAYRTFSLRQKVTSSTTWFTKALAGTVFGDVTLYLYNNTTELCRWKFSQCSPVAWRMELGDDGLPVERIDLVPTGIVRTRTGSTALGTPSVFPQANFTSGYTASTYRVSINGTAYATYVAASSTGVDVVYGPFGSSVTVTDTVLRQNPTADTRLFTWFNTWLSGGTTTYPVNLSVVSGSTTAASFTLNPAAPLAYTLQLADDGLPVEDFTIVAASAARP